MINPNGSNIRLARQTIQGILDRNHLNPYDRKDLMFALSKMRRAAPIRKAEPKHRGWKDKNLKRDILNAASLFPEASNQEISILCNTNTARVSECLGGLV